MSNTYSQLYMQFVFTVKRRECLIHESIRDKIEKVICGIVKKHACKPLAIYCNPDHTHLFVGLDPAISAAKLMEQVKSGSSKWINESKIIDSEFKWQRGYGVFTYSKSHISRVCLYIEHQREHHQKQTFKDEYILMLEQHEIAYDSRYLFDFIE